MRDAMVLVAKTRDLRLFKLVSPSQNWRIYVLEGSAPEQVAMLQALYSRSPKSIEDRIRDLAAHEQKPATDRLNSLSQKTRERLNGFLFQDQGTIEGLSEGRKTSLLKILETAGRELLEGHEDAVLAKVANFMEQFYVAYGHKSIGDCGSVVLFAEGVPLHLPTQVQDSALYSGQEASTRYLDMSSAYVWDPIGTETSAAIQADWMAFNRSSLPRMVDYLLTAHPRDAAQPEATHLRAIKARAFDILRGLLSIGVSTNASWAVNLRQGADHLRLMRHHPDRLVAAFGEDLLLALKSLYPKSYSHKENTATNVWLAMAMAEGTALVQGNLKDRDFNVRVVVQDPDRFLRVADILRTRPERVDIPRHLRNFAQISVTGSMDFGSFRDLHRHRALDIPVACIDWKDGTIEPWYLEMLPTDLRAEAETLLARQFERYNRLETDPFTRQVYAPLGTVMPFEARGSAGALIYMIELRSKNDVHPTARGAIWQIAEPFVAQLPTIPVTVDRRPDAFNVKRGEATIIDKNTGKDVAGHDSKEAAPA